MGKLNIAVVFGGKSAEHEISLRSAQNVINAIDKDKYNIVLLAIDKRGHWYVDADLDIRNIKFPLELSLFPHSIAFRFDGTNKLFVPEKANKEVPIDVFFPVLHGPYGEDGTIQGFFRTLQIPFVGCDVLGSAVGMDKDVMKRLFVEAEIPIGKYMTAHSGEAPTFKEVTENLGLPFYVKPANMGSSVGINKVESELDYGKALGEAFEYDQKIVLEENIDGLEIECAVLGNSQPEASTVGCVKSTHSFYSYTSKYLDDQGYKIEIPANIKPEWRENIRKVAVRVFKTLSAEGLGRVDVFLKKDGTILVNEINTLPGFTSISMYPMLWEASGLNYTHLIDKLIDLALEREKIRSELKVSF